MKRIIIEETIKLWPKHNRMAKTNRCLGDGTACLLGVMFLEHVTAESVSTADATDVLIQNGYTQGYCKGLMLGFDGTAGYHCYGEELVGLQDGQAVRKIMIG